MHAASVHPEPGSNSRTFCMSTAFAVNIFLFELFILALLTFFRVVFLFGFDRFCIRTCFFALYLYLLLFNCQVSMPRSFSSISFSVLLRACLLYHFIPCLSIGFLKLFLFFSSLFKRSKSDIFFVALNGNSLIISHLSPLVNTFFELFLPFFIFV